MSEVFDTAVGNMKVLMSTLEAGEERPWSDYKRAPQRGVYVFYEDGRPTYVGRSNRMPNRLRGHGADSSDQYSATFAFKLLKEVLEKREGKPPKGTRKAIQAAHAEEYRRQRERVRSMTFKAVAIGDQLEQDLFEVYAILETGTYPHHNDFKTY